MLALVKPAPGPGLDLAEVPMPEVGINDVLVRVHRTGICGTDLHIDAWDAWAAKTIVPPLVVGHEFVGEIVAIGSNVNDFAVGDLVSGEGHVVCGRCRHCLAGRRNLCAHTIGLGVGRDGAFAEYVVLPMSNIWHHWPGIDEDVAAIFDPFGNAVHTALAFPRARRGRARVRAPGPSGSWPRRSSATPARGSSSCRSPTRSGARSRRAWARPWSWTPPRRTSREVQTALGMVEGFDVALEMSGNATALRSAIASMAHGGAVAILGIPTAEISLDVNEIVFKMLTLRGIYGREMYETWYKMTVMLQSGLDITPAITHRFPFREHRAAFAAARAGGAGKVILDWTA